MLLGRRTRKVVAATFLSILLTNTFAPGISYALTSGPTQPEATSFEPIDTTDMVNLVSGGLTYNVPLVEVPGPEGNYPLALSYHAGIQPNEEASWVGLGWNLNPGAVSRNVNGYPDEWFGVNNTSHVYWSGGHTSTFSIGFSLPIAGAAGVSFGLSFSQDTYRGFGVGFYEGAYVGLGNSPFSVSAGVGVSPYGEPYATAGLGVTASGKDGGLTGSLGINVTTNFNGSTSVGFSAGVGYSVAHHDDAKNPGKVTSRTNFSLLGASISTDDGKPALSVGGLSAHVSSTNVAKVTTSTSGFSTSGIGLPISIGWSKTRYYIDQLTNVNTFGSLSNYGWVTNGDKSLVDNIAFDTYSLPEDPSEKNMVDYPDPNVLQGGAFDDYDQYMVVAQGVGGAIRPYKQIGQARGQNIKNGDGSYRVQYYSPSRPGFLPDDDMYPQFRFVGDFSNSWRQNNNVYASGSLSASPLPSLTLPFDPNPAYGYQDPDNPNEGPDYGYYSSTNYLAGSRSVSIGTDNVNPHNTPGYTYVSSAQGEINGFTITNESGVRYIFGLPAYTYGEEVYQEKIDQSKGFSYNRQHKNTHYAYTWYLTSVVGPDYIDRNQNSIADDGDWGYWVNFEYGKWSGNFAWRNPSNGYNIDEDNGWKDCSMGYKEVYYLNAIRTRTNVALFEKDLRPDSKSESNSIFTQASSGTYADTVKFDLSSISSLKLSHIYLMNTADANFVTTTSGGGIGGNGSSGNVLDASDVNAVGRANLEAKSLRVIDFKYDYSLCDGTENSFTSFGQLQGKLTLLALKTRGKGGVEVVPPNQFQYEQDDAVVDPQAQRYSQLFVTNNPNFKVGDIVKSSVSGQPDVYAGVITSIVANSPSAGLYTCGTYGDRYTGPMITAKVSTTKNPPYDKDKFDIWGMYKSDANMALINQKASSYRKTTIVSSGSVDAWSLRKITTPLGGTVKIGYESNTMKGSVLNNDLPISLQQGSLGYDAQSGGLSAQVHFSWLATHPDYTFFSPPAVGTTGTIAFQGTVPAFPIAKTVASAILTFTITQVDANGLLHATLSSPISTSTTWTDGIMFFNNIINSYVGGGPRIRNITTQSDPASEVYTTSYQYNTPGTNQSSGVTSYFPVGLDMVPDKLRFAYLSVISPIYSLARELPQPGVMYEYVSVTKQVQYPGEAVRNMPGSTLYQYEVFKPNMVGRIEVQPRQSGTYNGTQQLARYYALEKFTGGIGNVKRVTQLDNQGNKLQETINNYLHDDLIGEDLTSFMNDYKNRLANYHYQGLLEERLAEVKHVNNQDKRTTDQVAINDVSFKSTITMKEDLPCIQTGTTMINYVNGTKVVNKNLAFDFFSGAVTQSLETDAYGNNILTKTIPAYRKNPSMGLRYHDLNNIHDRYPNMLSQVTETYTYKSDASGTPLGLIAATVNLWSEAVPAMAPDGSMHTQNGYPDGDVWRQQALYSWMPSGQTSDGTTPVADFSAADFNWSNPSASDARWRKTTEYTLYDVYSKSLETKDINGNYGASHLNYGDQRVVLNGSPANFYEIAYSGAEDANLNQTANAFVKAADGGVSTTAAHTGASSLQLAAAGKKGFLYTVPIVASGNGGVLAGRNYVASVWVKPVSGTASDVKLYYSVNGVTKTPSVSSGASTKTAGGWTLINLSVKGSDLTAGVPLSVWCQNDHGSAQAYVDDMRFQPLNATTSAYVYDPFSGELTHILDNSNLYTRFEYDAGGRLVRTYKEKLNTGAFSGGEFKTNQFAYNYGSPKFGNDAIVSKSYLRNTCPVGLSPAGQQFLSAAAGAYTSYVSKDDANALADQYLQDYANTHGNCICIPVLNWEPYISGVIFQIIPSSTQPSRISFTFVFQVPATGASSITLGRISGCVLPTAQRTVPVLVGSSTYYVVISTDGTVQAILASGSEATGTMGVSGVYDMNTDLQYSDQQSGYFTRTCPAGQSSHSYQYIVPQYRYAAIDKPTANALAVNDLNTNGPIAAANQPLCYVSCDFSWLPQNQMPIILNTYSASVTPNGSNIDFQFVFAPGADGFSNGTLGTITGGCHPSIPVTVNISDNGGRTWNVTINPTGQVNVLNTSGSYITAGTFIVLSGSVPNN